MKQPSTSQPMAPPPPGAAVDTATLELLAAWMRQDATEQIRAAEQEVAEFKKSMDENRGLAGEPKLYS